MWYVCVVSVESVCVEECVQCVWNVCALGYVCVKGMQSVCGGYMCVTGLYMEDMCVWRVCVWCVCVCGLCVWRVCV